MIFTHKYPWSLDLISLYTYLHQTFCQYWLEIPDRPAERQLCGGELDPVHGVVAVLDEGSGDLVPVVTAIISRVVCNGQGLHSSRSPEIATPNLAEYSLINLTSSVLTASLGK